MTRRRACTCGQEWAAHGLSDAARQLAMSRQAIQHHVTHLRLGTPHHDRVHLSTADLIVLRAHITTLRRTRRQRRLLAAGIG